MKKIVLVFLAALLLFSLTACVAAPASSESPYAGMEPAAAAEKAAGETKDTMDIADIVKIPFGYLMDWLYTLTSNYGVALILFSLIVKLILLPAGIKSKKNSLATARLQPEVNALKDKYGDDQQKINQATMELYKEEGVSMGGGCLWSLLPLLILLPLYYIIREPITYVLHNPRSVSAAIVAFMQASGANLGSNSFYAQLAAAGHIGEFEQALRNVAVTAAANLRQIDFQFLGIDLGAIPTFRFWEAKGWAEMGLCLIPVVSAAFQLVSMLVSQKMNNSVTTNADGEQDKDAAKAANQTMTTMMFIFPLTSLWIGYSMPAAMSIYWIAQALFGTVQDVWMTLHYRKVYEAEDEERQKRAAARRAREEERERQRQLRREQNPDGITDNVSKKKLRQQEKNAAEKAAKDYEARRNPGEAEEKKPLSGDPERPWCKGRAYDPDRYTRTRAKAELEDAEQTEE